MFVPSAALTFERVRDRLGVQAVRSVQLCVMSLSMLCMALTFGVLIPDSSVNLASVIVFVVGYQRRDLNALSLRSSTVVSPLFVLSYAMFLASHHLLGAGVPGFNVGVHDLLLFIMALVWQPAVMYKVERESRLAFVTRYKNEVMREQVNVALEPSPAERAAMEKAFGGTDAAGEASLPTDCEIPLSEVHLVRIVGQGANCEVWTARCFDSTVAVKLLQRHRLVKKEAVDLFRREIIITERARHPYVVGFIGYVLNPPRVFMVLEFCSRGDLLACLQGPGGRRLTWQDPLTRLVTEAAHACLHLHSLGLLIRDVKVSTHHAHPRFFAPLRPLARVQRCAAPPTSFEQARNCLLHDSWSIRLADLGSAVFADHSSELVGTAR